MHQVFTAQQSDQCGRRHTSVIGDLSHHIETLVIQPAMVVEMKRCIQAQRRWHQVAEITETVAHIMLLVNVMLASVYHLMDGNILPCELNCIISVTPILLLKCVAHAINESEEYHGKLEQYCVYLGIDTKPVPLHTTTQDILPSETVPVLTLVPKLQHCIQRRRQYQFISHVLQLLAEVILVLNMYLSFLAVSPEYMDNSYILMGMGITSVLVLLLLKGSVHCWKCCEEHHVEMCEHLVALGIGAPPSPHHATTAEEQSISPSHSFSPTRSAHSPCLSPRSSLVDTVD
jgi:hypothetical protein